MLDDAESLHGSGNGCVYDDVWPQRRPVRPRPGRRAAESSSPERQPERSRGRAGRRGAETSSPEAAPPRQTAAPPGHPQEAPARPLSRVARRRAARAAEEARSRAEQAASEQAEEGQVAPTRSPRAPARVPVLETQEEQDPVPAFEVSDPVPAQDVLARSLEAVSEPEAEPQQDRDLRQAPERQPPGRLRQRQQPPPAGRDSSGRPLSRTLPLTSVPGLQDDDGEDPPEEPAPAQRRYRSDAGRSGESRSRRRRAPAPGSHRRGPGRTRPHRSRGADQARSHRGVLARTLLGSRLRLLGMTAAAGVVLLWLLAAALTSSTVAARTVCSGVPIGGMSHDQAAQAIEIALAEQVNGPLYVSADGATVQLSGSAVKARVDGAQSIRSLTGFTMNPQVLLRRLMGGQEVKAVVTADPEAVRAELSNHLDQLSHGAVSAQVSLVDGQVLRTAASTGTGVDLDSATAMLSASWPVASGETIVLPEGVTEPAVTDAEASAFATNVLEPLVSGPVTLTVAGTEAEGRASKQTHELSAEELMSLATVKEEGGALTVVLDPVRLREQVIEGLGAGIETQGTGYKWTIDGSEAGAPNARPQLVAATSGRVVDGGKLSKAIVDGVSNSGVSAATRTVTLELSEGAADTSSEADAQALGVKEVVGSSDTPFESDPQRDQNLRAGAAAVNGTLILPGQSYSMAQTIGPVEPERGYAPAGVIVGSKHVNGMGGGLSQVTTTVFNAAYAAGMEDDEHTPHSQYMSRYPAGLEATLWSGQIDMRFTNTTPYAVLLQAWVGEGHVHVRAWSTRYYDVEISTSDRFNVVPQGHSRSTDADCLPNPEGQPGFDITVTRRRSLNGTALPAEVHTVHYEPNDSVTCG